MIQSRAFGLFFAALGTRAAASSREHSAPRAPHPSPSRERPLADARHSDSLVAFERFAPLSQIL